MEGALEKLLLLDRLEEVYRQIRANPGDVQFFQRVLQVLNVRALVAESDLARVPKDGPLVVVANHPFGLIEGMVAGAVLPAVRPDMKIMTNSLLTGFEEARESAAAVSGEAASSDSACCRPAPLFCLEPADRPPTDSSLNAASSEPFEPCLLTPICSLP